VKSTIGVIADLVALPFTYLLTFIIFVVGLDASAEAARMDG
jgi:hypothetical protein